MKAQRMLVLVVLCGAMACQSGMAFYNSSTGRWLSRDPINEVGFKESSPKSKRAKFRDNGNLYHFIRNNPVNGIDLVGLEDNIWGYCCCGKAGRISAKPISTGVRKCSADSTIEGVDHGWLEIDDWSEPDNWSADFNTDGSVVSSTGTVNIPTDYAKKKSKKCEDVILSPCKYDFKKFRENIKSEAEKDKANPPTYSVVPFVGDQCFSWANDIIDRAMKKSGPCGGEVSAK